MRTIGADTRIFLQAEVCLLTEPWELLELPGLPELHELLELVQSEGADVLDPGVRWIRTDLPTMKPGVLRCTLPVSTSRTLSLDSCDELLLCLLVGLPSVGLS